MRRKTNALRSRVLCLASGCTVLGPPGAGPPISCASAWVAREVHDGVGQVLTLLRYRLEQGLLECDRGEMRDARASVRRALRLIRQADTEIRRISRGLGPLRLRAAGLSGAVADLLAEVGANPAIKVDVDWRVQDDSLDRTQRATILRILEEALTNVARHARASRVLVRLSLARGRYTLLVRDNGRGMPRGTQSAGTGLKNIAVRAAQLGGDCRIAPRRGGGTELRVAWPASEGSE